jgi:hypothetical protein
MKSEVYEEKVNTRDELVARIMNSAALIKQERQDNLRRAYLLTYLLTTKHARTCTFVRMLGDFSIYSRA